MKKYAVAIMLTAVATLMGCASVHIVRDTETAAIARGNREAVKNIVSAANVELRKLKDAHNGLARAFEEHSRKEEVAIKPLVVDVEKKKEAVKQP